MPAAERLHYEVEGDGERPALLLLHGIMSSNLQWAPNRERLREHFRLVAVELWGHGASPAPRDPERYRVAGYLEELERIRAELGLRHWLVCGQSFGAGLAIRYCLAHPESARGLVFTNSRSALSDLAREARDPGADAWERLDPRTLPFHPCHAKRFPAELKTRMVAVADAIPPRALWQATATTAREVCCRELAGGLRLPTLLVNGRYEKVFQPDRDFAARTIEGIEIVDCEAGHSVNVEDPERFDAALIGFAQRRL